MKRIATIGICAILASPAMAQSLAEKTGLNEITGQAPSTQDFVAEAARSDMFEIQSSKMALGAGDSADKSFAQQMIVDHTKTTAELKAATASGKVNATLPSALSSAQQSMVDKLQSLHGNAFDEAYADDQIKVHKDAVSLFQRYSQGGTDPTLKEWAGKTLPTLQHHLMMAQNLSK